MKRTVQEILTEYQRLAPWLDHVCIVETVSVEHWRTDLKPLHRNPCKLFVKNQDGTIFGSYLACPKPNFDEQWLADVGTLLGEIARLEVGS